MVFSHIKIWCLFSLNRTQSPSKWVIYRPPMEPEVFRWPQTAMEIRLPRNEGFVHSPGPKMTSRTITRYLILFSMVKMEWNLGIFDLLWKKSWNDIRIQNSLIWFEIPARGKFKSRSCQTPSQRSSSRPGWSSTWRCSPSRSCWLPWARRGARP